MKTVPATTQRHPMTHTFTPNEYPLSASSQRPRTVGHRLWGPWLWSYAVVCSVTLASALVVTIAGSTAKGPVRGLLGLRLSASTNPPPCALHALALSAHNLPIECWPVLLGILGAHRNPLSRALADGAVGVWVLVNTLPVGSAIGAYGTPLFAYIPQLPFEWAGLALGVSAWLSQRQDQMTPRLGALICALAAGVLLVAGMLETFAVPHQ
jgi:hypothetical protein